MRKYTYKRREFWDNNFECGSNKRRKEFNQSYIHSDFSKWYLQVNIF